MTEALLTIGSREVPGYVRESYAHVTPRLITPDVTGLAEFIRAVFDASADVVPGRPVELKIGNSIIMVSDGGGVRSHMSAMLYVYVPDADKAFRLARDAGVEVIEEPCDTPWGDRRATVADRWGNVWQIATAGEPAPH